MFAAVNNIRLWCEQSFDTIFFTIKQEFLQKKNVLQFIVCISAWKGTVKKSWVLDFSSSLSGKLSCEVMTVSTHRPESIAETLFVRAF